MYPTLARIALDVLPCQASSVPCERLFMKFAWRQNIVDLAAWNSAQVEEVGLEEYSELLEEEGLAAKWDNEITTDKIILDD